MLGNVVAATALMDRFGRRVCLLIGIAGTGACLAFEAALTKYYVGAEPPNKVGLGFGTFFIFLFVVFYATFIDAQQYVIVSEAFPMEFRSIGVALSLFAQTAAAALFVGVAPTSKLAASLRCGLNGSSASYCINIKDRFHTCRLEVLSCLYLPRCLYFHYGLGILSRGMATIPISHMP